VIAVTLAARPDRFVIQDGKLFDRRSYSDPGPCSAPFFADPAAGPEPRAAGSADKARSTTLRSRYGCLERNQTTRSSHPRRGHAHIAGSVLRLTAGCRVVLCGSEASTASRNGQSVRAR
jgi:hypothetical protein